MTEPTPLTTGSGAVKTTTITPTVNAPGGYGWYRNVGNDGKVVVVKDSNPTPKGPAVILGRQYYLPSRDPSNYVKPIVTPPPSSTDSAPIAADPKDMKFNLPPHQWSLPVDSSLVTNSSKYAGNTDHSLRRGRLWFFNSAQLSSAKVSYSPSTGLEVNQNSGVTLSYGTNSLSDASMPASITAEDNYWGFQFLWNPTEVSNVISRNSNFTPSSTDALAGLQGLFTAQELVSFTIVIDRINDFAWGASVLGSAYIGSQLDPNGNLYNALNGGGNPYTAGGNPGVAQDQSQQIRDLISKGTMADVEYLFRAINGSGVGGKKWSNALGKETADIGFLSPNPIALQLGPDVNNNLSYVGWVESLAIKHSVFTENMLPLHTEISVQFNGFSRVSLKSGN